MVAAVAFVGLLVACAQSQPSRSPDATPNSPTELSTYEIGVSYPLSLGISHCGIQGAMIGGEVWVPVPRVVNGPLRFQWMDGYIVVTKPRRAVWTSDTGLAVVRLKPWVSEDRDGPRPGPATAGCI